MGGLPSGRTACRVPWLCSARVGSGSAASKNLRGCKEGSVEAAARVAVVVPPVSLPRRCVQPKLSAGARSGAPLTLAERGSSQFPPSAACPPSLPGPSGQSTPSRPISQNVRTGGGQRPRPRQPAQAAARRAAPPGLPHGPGVLRGVRAARQPERRRRGHGEGEAQGQRHGRPPQRQPRRPGRRGRGRRPQRHDVRLGRDGARRPAQRLLLGLHAEPGARRHPVPAAGRVAAAGRRPHPHVGVHAAAARVRAARRLEGRVRQPRAAGLHAGPRVPVHLHPARPLGAPAREGDLLHGRARKPAAGAHAGVAHLRVHRGPLGLALHLLLLRRPGAGHRRPAARPGRGPALQALPDLRRGAGLHRDLRQRRRRAPGPAADAVAGCHLVAVRLGAVAGAVGAGHGLLHLPHQHPDLPERRPGLQPRGERAADGAALPRRLPVLLLVRLDGGRDPREEAAQHDQQQEAVHRHVQRAHRDVRGGHGLRQLQGGLRRAHLPVHVLLRAHVRRRAGQLPGPGAAAHRAHLLRGQHDGGRAGRRGPPDRGRHRVGRDRRDPVEGRVLGAGGRPSQRPGALHVAGQRRGAALEPPRLQQQAETESQHPGGTAARPTADPGGPAAPGKQDLAQRGR